jgi:hypothetical protein
MFGLFEGSNKEVVEDNLVDEKENKGLVFILFLVFIGLGGIAFYAYENDTIPWKNTWTAMATLFFVSGAIFTSSSLVGFLFGIPRTTVIDKSEKSKSGYIGNDNLLQVSDWITKIILGLGLTQIHQIPTMLQKVAGYIHAYTGVSNQAFIILVILYFACLGFLFGYLWTRLYFIKMLRDSDHDVNDDDSEMTAHVKTQITTDVTTGVTTGDEKK